MNKNIYGDIKVNFHASIRIENEGIVLYFDPYKIKGDNVNDADYIFITHKHYDHFSKEDINKVLGNDTKLIVPLDLKDDLIEMGISDKKIISVKPSETYKVDNINFETIVSYNINKEYHKKEYNWVGYIVYLGDISYYVIGDSDVIPEMDNVYADVLFVPVGGTYTMNSIEAAKLTNRLKPKYAIPIHYDEVGSVNDAEKFIENIDINIKGIVI